MAHLALNLRVDMQVPRDTEGSALYRWARGAVVQRYGAYRVTRSNPTVNGSVGRSRVYVSLILVTVRPRSDMVGEL